ncbi:MAG: hypothetical protein ACOYMA_08115 [Bacteroidia bacterium]
MEKTIGLLLLALFSLLCNAQQKIAFIENKTFKEVNYTLPQKVELVDNNGHYKRLVLEKVVGDSLFFSDLKLKDVFYSCYYYDLKHIQFHKKNEALNQFFTVSFAASAGYFGLLSVMSLGAIALKVPQEDGILYIMAGFSTPVAILSGIISHACNKHRSKPFRSHKWRLVSEKSLLLN